MRLKTAALSLLALLAVGVAFADNFSGPAGRFISVGGSIDLLGDVNTAGKSDGNCLVYNFSTGNWMPGVCGAGGGSSSLSIKNGGVQISSPTQALNFSSNTFVVTQGPVGTSTVTLNFSSVTAVGNVFNAANKLLLLDGTGKVLTSLLPASVSLFGTSVDLPTQSQGNYVQSVVAGSGVSISPSSPGHGTDNTLSLNPGTLTGDQSWADGSATSVTWRWVVPGVAPRFTFSDGLIQTLSELDAPTFVGTTMTADTISAGLSMTSGGKNVAQYSNTVIAGSTVAYSSGTIQNLNTTTLKFNDGTTMTTASAGGAGGFWVGKATSSLDMNGFAVTGSTLVVTSSFSVTGATETHNSITYISASSTTVGTGQKLRAYTVTNGQMVESIQDIITDGMELKSTDTKTGALILQSSFTLPSVIQMGNPASVGQFAYSTSTFGSSWGGPVFYDGVQRMNMVGVATTSSPLNGWVPSWDSSTGRVLWQAQSGSGGAGTPGGSNQQIQFNNAGSFNGVAVATYNATTQLLTYSSGSVHVNVSSETFHNVRLVMSGTSAIQWPDGTVQVSSPSAGGGGGGSGTITGVTAGYGLSGGGTSGGVTLNLVTNSTSYIQNSNTQVAGSTASVAFLYVGSSATVSGPFEVKGGPGIFTSLVSGNSPFNLRYTGNLSGDRLLMPLYEDVGFGFGSVSSEWGYNFGGTQGTTGWIFTDDSGNERVKIQTDGSNINGIGVANSGGLMSVKNTIDDGGSFGVPTVSTTSNLTLGTTHFLILADATSGNITLTLPDLNQSAASGVERRWYRACKTDASANTVSFAKDASDSFAGGSTSLTTQWECVDVIGSVSFADTGSTTAGKWRVINRTLLSYSSGGGGYAIEPATVTIQANKGIIASTITVSTLTVTAGLNFTSAGTINFSTGANLNITSGSTFSTTAGSTASFAGAFLDSTASAGTSGKVWTSNGSGTAPTWQAAAAGGSSSLAISTAGVIVTSPTVRVDFDSNTFVGALGSVNVASITLNISSVTLQGNTFNAANKLLQLTASGVVGAAQVPTFAGDVTTPGGSLTTTIGSHAVSNAKFRQGAALSVVGVTGNATADVADIAGIANQSLRVNGAGTALAFGAIDLSQSAAVTGSLPAASIAAGSLGNQVIASSIAASGVTAGSYGTASNVSSFTVSGDGRITGAANVAIAISGNAVSGGTFGAVNGSALTNLTGSNVGSGIPAANIAAGSLGPSVLVSSLTTVVTAGTYGSATISPTITFNAQGQIIAASSNTIPGASVAGSTGAITMIFDGSGSAITTGSTSTITIPYNCTISSWTVKAPRESGSVTVGISKGTSIPTWTDLVGGSGNKPSLTSAQNNGAAPASWSSTSISQGDTIAFCPLTATTVTWVQVTLWLLKT